MAITSNNKLVDVSLLDHFEDKLAEKYLEQKNAETTYAKAADLTALKSSLGTTEKSTTTTEGMTTLKDTAQEGDIYKNTDDSKYYVFVGEGKEGADANGFVELGETFSLGSFATRDELEKASAKAGLDVDTKLGEYTKTANLADDPGISGKYLDKETAGTTYATKTEMTNLGTVLGETTKEELDSKKGESTVGDCWVTTDDNHIHYYNGTDFVDLGGNLDLGPYLKSEDASTTYVKVADIAVAEEADIDALFSPAPVI